MLIPAMGAVVAVPVVLALTLFRQPDAHLGFLWGPLTMGMLLSLPLLLFGIVLVVRALRRPLLPLEAA